jgi:hypothetical protein
LLFLNKFVVVENKNNNGGQTVICFANALLATPKGATPGSPDAIIFIFSSKLLALRACFPFRNAKQKTLRSLRSLVPPTS